MEGDGGRIQGRVGGNGRRIQRRVERRGRRGREEERWEGRFEGEWEMNYHVDTTTAHMHAGSTSGVPQWYVRHCVSFRAAGREIVQTRQDTVEPAQIEVTITTSSLPLPPLSHISLLPSFPPSLSFSYSHFATFPHSVPHLLLYPSPLPFSPPYSSLLTFPSPALPGPTPSSLLSSSLPNSPPTCCHTHSKSTPLG